MISATGALLHHPRIPPIAGLTALQGTKLHSRPAGITRFRCSNHGGSVPGPRAYNSPGWARSMRCQSPCSSAPHNGAAVAQPSIGAGAFPPRFPCLGLLAYKAGLSSKRSRPAQQSRFAPKAGRAVCRASLRRVCDPRDCVGALTPDWRADVQRLVMSGGFYRAIQRDDVQISHRRYRSRRTSGHRH